MANPFEEFKKSLRKAAEIQEQIVAPTRLFDTDTGMTMQLRIDIEAYATSRCIEELEVVKNRLSGIKSLSPNHDLINSIISVIGVDEQIKRLKGKDQS